MCAIDWGFIAAWVGALATFGLLIAAIVGFSVWKNQFLTTRDHDLARRMLRGISDSLIVFDELRTPHALLSDGDEPVAPPTAEDLPGQFEHRQMYARYKARSMHLDIVRRARTATLFEALALWDDEDYAVGLGEFINQIAQLEDAVLVEAMHHVESLAPGSTDIEIDNAVLFAPLDPTADDLMNADYLAIKDRVLQHLRPKIRMD